jgi:hypothetical protein
MAPKGIRRELELRKLFRASNISWGAMAGARRGVVGIQVSDVEMIVNQV